MKKLLLLFGIILIAAGTLLSQAPQAFKYQAIARDTEGNIIANQQVSLKINLLQDNESGQTVYTETHTLKTNQFGLINLEIGNGKNNTGDFSAINWGLSKYYVNIEMDANGGSDYKSMGVSPLLSVPYALYAETTGNNSGGKGVEWTNSGSVTYLTNSGYNVGIGLSAPVSKLHVTASGLNAVYERNISTAAGPANRFYKSRGTAASKTQVQAGDNLGQFQFWGMGDDGTYDIGATLKGVAENTRTGTDLFDVAASIQFLTTNNAFSWGERMRITADGNVGIGTTSPSYKLDVAGDINYTGDLKQSGTTVLSVPPVNNTFVGLTGNITNTGNDNTFLGFLAGLTNTSGSYNTFLGSLAGTNNQIGSNNTFIGHKAGGTHVSGNDNICIGGNAGPVAGSMSHQLYISPYAGTPLIYGDFNNVEVGIATTVPGTNLAIYENNTHLNPALLINQGGAGDAAMRYLLSVAGAAGTNFSVGIDADDNTNFKITTANNLGSIPNPGYADPSTMMRIHNENPLPGILDINHQSRARVWLNDNSTALAIFNTWTMIPFDKASYDEHTEWLLYNGQVSEFIALEEGYYQVNARTEIDYAVPPPIVLYDPGIWPPTVIQYSIGGYCSIAIYKSNAAGGYSMYSQGNNLDLKNFNVLGGIEFEPLNWETNNNAPNVSDVVYLQAGERIQIRVYHNAVQAIPPAGSFNPLNFYIKTGSSQTYCSVHKVS